MKIKGKLLSCLVAWSLLGLLLPASAFAAAGDTYTKATTITEDGTYLFASGIYALNRNSGTWYSNNTGSSALTALGEAQRFDLMADFGNRDFTVNGATLTETAPTYTDDTINARYAYTITSANISDGANPGYYIKRGSSYLDLCQTWTELTYPITGQTFELGSTGQYVSLMATVTDPLTRLSSAARVWYWNGSNFYTRYTSDTTSIGQLIPPGSGFWSGSYLLSTTDGWAWINWNAVNIRNYQNETFFLTGAYTSNGGFYDFALPTVFHPEMTYVTQYGFRGTALFASSNQNPYTFGNVNGGGFQISPLSLYKLNQSFTGATVNIRLNGSPSNIQAGNTIALYQSGSSKYSGTIATGAAAFTFPSPVLEGTYDVYIGGSDTGTNIVVNANAASVMVDYYSLTVSNGTGSGNYLPGKTVTVTASAPPAGQVFKQWTTGTAGVSFASTTSSTTTFTMPASTVSVNATFEDATYTMTAAKQSGAASVIYGYADSAGDIVVRVTNTGNSPINNLAANVVNTTGTAFTGPATLSTTTLGAGATMDIAIDFATGGTIGTYIGTLQVTGDNGANASYSLSQTVTQRAISLSLTANPTTIDAFDSTTLTATIGNASGEVPRGTITFKKGTEIINSGVAISENAGVISASLGWLSVPAGIYDLSAEYVAALTDNYTATAAATLDDFTVSKIDQTGFSFTDSSPIVKTYSDASFDVTATGGQSSGSISYAVTDGAGVVGVDPTSGAITILAVGTATITATHSGDSNYNDATATITINVAKAANTLEVTCDGIEYGQSLATALHITNTSGGAVTYLYEGTGSTIYSGFLPPTAVGTYRVTLSSAATDTYLAGTASTTFAITKATPLLSLTLDPTTLHGSGHITADLTAANPYDPSLIEGLPASAQINFTDSDGILQSFIVNGQDGTYTGDLTIANASAITTITASFVGNASYSATQDQADLTVTYAAGPGDNRIDGIVTGETRNQGQAVNFAAIGGGVDNTAPLRGDTRFVPVSWRVGGLSGSWTLPSSLILPDSLSSSLFNGTIDTSLLPTGTNNLEVTFALQSFNGEEWQDMQLRDTETVSFIVSVMSTTSSTPETGDTSSWIWVVCGLLGCALLCGAFALNIKRRTTR